MKVLIVNNSEQYPELLAECFKDAEIKIISYSDLIDIDDSLFDCAVLSGSSNFPIVGNENEMLPELQFIRSTAKPVLGICYGFELIVVAFGGTLKMMDHKAQGVLEMRMTASDPIFRGVEKLFVYEGHHWVADTLPPSLLPLAESAHGIEAIRHTDRLIYGFQFHPEKLMRETEGSKVIKNFIEFVRAQ